MTGTIKRWRKDGIYWAKNDWITMAYAIDDGIIDKISEHIGIGPDGETCVSYITPEQAKAWDGCGEIEPS